MQVSFEDCFYICQTQITRDPNRPVSIILYNIFLFFFRIGIHTGSLFNKKAKKWIAGRKDIFEKLRSAISGYEKTVWMHCASLGEFEQGRPVLEKMRAVYPDHN